MNWALIGFTAIVLAGACVVGPAQAIPVAPSRDALAAQSAPLLPVRYYRHHWHHRHHWHYRHYGYSRRGHSRWARSSAPEQTGEIKAGRWEFVAQLQTAAMPQLAAGRPLPEGTEPQSGGGIKTSYFGCVASDKAVPAEFGPQCKLDGSDRSGSNITWSMTCTNPQGAVRSDGVAQYSGDTMQATMVSHLPGPNGKVTDMTQHITGRYLGPCAQSRQ